jgi:hypothetical protein
MSDIILRYSLGNYITRMLLSDTSLCDDSFMIIQCQVFVLTTKKIIQEWIINLTHEWILKWFRDWIYHWVMSDHEWVWIYHWVMSDHEWVITRCIITQSSVFSLEIESITEIVLLRHERWMYEWCSLLIHDWCS